MRPGADDIALVVFVDDAEAGIDGGLVGVGGGAVEIVEVEPRKELVFRGNGVVEPEGKLVGVGRHLGRGRVGVGAKRTSRQIGQRVAFQDGQEGIVYRNFENVGHGGAVGLLVGDGVVHGAVGGASRIGALRERGNGEDLGGAEHLAEALVLAEVEGSLTAIVEVRQKDRAAVGEAELVAAEGRNAPGGFRRGVVEIIARIKGRVAHKFKHRAVEAAGAGAGDDVGEAGGAAADFGRHPSGLRLNLLHRVHVEVGEGGAAHLGIADVSAVLGENGFDATLAVDGELRGEVGGAIGVGHGAGSEQQ